jgi:hypothetical protein
MVLQAVERQVLLAAGAVLQKAGACWGTASGSAKPGCSFPIVTQRAIRTVLTGDIAN